MTRVSAGLCARAASATACGVSPMSARTRVRSPCVDEGIGEPEAHDLDGAADSLQDGAAEPAGQRVLLDGDEAPVCGGEPLQQLRIQRLDEARVDDRGRDALGGEQLGRLAGDADAGADADERDVGALLEHHPAAHLERLERLRAG